MESSKKAWGNGVFFLATLGFNALGAAGVINGLSQNEISDKYMTLITPSPSTFSIWGVIYISLLASLVIMIVKKDDAYYQAAVEETSLLFRISCLLNIAWIIAFSYLQLVLSSIFIFAFVVTLSLICLRLLKIHQKRRLLLPFTFGLYAGWVFVATVVNLAATLVKMKWDGYGLNPDTWAGIILLISVVLIFLVTQRLKNVIFPIPVAWAYFGIYQSLKSPEGFDGKYETLQIIAIVAMAVLIFIALVQFYQNRYLLLPKNRREK